MDEPHTPPRDTREFLAIWSTATADHLTRKLTGILQDLPRRVPDLPAMSESQAATVSPILIGAFQVAAAPEGGVHAAVQFLAEYGGDVA